MSYSSRVYRQRNAHAHDEAKQKPFFSGQHDTKKPSKKNKTVQAKLAVNKAGDSYEQEADAMANTLANQNSKTPVVHKKEISAIQRLSTPAEDEQLGTNDARMKKDKDIQEKPIQLKGEEPGKDEEKAIQKVDEPKKEEEKAVQKMDEPKKEEEKAVQKMDEPKKEEEKAVQKMDEPKKEEEKAVQKMDEPKTEEEGSANAAAVQKKGTDQSAGVSPAISTYLDQSAGKGNPLPAKTLKEMSSNFGIDFSNVRIHNDQDAITAANKLEAQAFTHGRDVYFNEGKFDPGTAKGQFLLAHELTHVAQQNHGGLKTNVNRQPAQPPANQQVPGISTPVPGGIQPTPKGEYETIINGAKIIIRPDIHSRQRGKGAETKFKQSGGGISNIKTDKGKIKSFDGPTQILVAIQTTYQKDAKSSDTSAYGKGTTQQDIAAGDTTLGFHEGSHGIDYINYITTNALPVFGGAVGMTVKEFEANVKTYSSEIQTYFTGMSKASEASTDCVGTTIDQLSGSNVCEP